MRALALALAFALAGVPSVAGALSEPDDAGASPRDLVDLVASRPAAVRDAALEASLYPDTLVRMELIQARSSAAFEVRAERLDREHEEELWELVRYPGLLSDIVEGGAKSDAALEDIADAYPDDVRDIVLHLGGEHFATLEEAHAIRAAADVEFDDAIAGLPDDARAAFRELVDDPELLAAMGRSPSAVAQLADEYRASPRAARQHLDAVAAEQEAETDRAEAAWRETVESDPEARRELEAAARRYADEYGYDYDGLTRPDVNVTVNVYHHAYPYWFGYPRWYSHWHPWGVWYPVVPHFGFAYRSPGVSFFFGLPSPHFVSWYFGGYYDAYPRLSNCFDRYYVHRYPTYRPSYRYARYARYHRAPRGGLIARVRRDRPAYVAPATWRAEHRERGIERRAERRALGIERRDDRRDRGIERRAERRDNGLDRREERRANGRERRDERRDNGIERRDERRTRGVERREERRDNGLERREERRANGAERRDERRANGQERREERRTNGVERRAERRDDGLERREERRDAGIERRDERRTNAEARRDERRDATAERRDARAEAASQRRAPGLRRVEVRRDTGEARRTERREASQQRVEQRRERSQERVEQRRSRAEERRSGRRGDGER
ncbi:MAG: hypothetical protein R3E88_11890 [Myxococcota bacterium]